MKNAIKLSWLVISSALVSGGTTASAASINVNNPYVQLVTENYDEFLGTSAGTFIRYGADSVVPNGNGGTTGVAIVSNPTTGTQLFSAPINYAPSVASPNFFQSSLGSANSNFTAGSSGNWSLQFSNSTNTNIISPISIASAQVIPLVTGVSLTGGPTSVTFQWQAPSGVSVNGYEILVADEQSGFANKTVVNGVITTGTSYTLNLASLPPQAQATDQFQIEIRAVQTVNGATLTSSNAGDANIQSFSQTNVPFKFSSSSSQVYLPTVNSNGSYSFNIPVATGQTYNIDPKVATGYVYQTGATDPNFASVKAVTSVGSGIYQLWVWNNNQFVLADATLAVGQTFDFLTNGYTNGVSEFEILGIDPNAGLDPTDTTAFITALTFDGAGDFTGTQTPIASEVTPLPAALPLFATGLGGLGFFGWHRKRKGQAIAA